MPAEVDVWNGAFGDLRSDSRARPGESGAAVRGNPRASRDLRKMKRPPEREAGSSPHGNHAVCSLRAWSGAVDPRMSTLRRYAAALKRILNVQQSDSVIDWDINVHLRQHVLRHHRWCPGPAKETPMRTPPSCTRLTSVWRFPRAAARYTTSKPQRTVHCTRGPVRNWPTWRYLDNGLDVLTG